MKDHQVEVKTIRALEQWLSKNHSQKESVWLVYYKSTSGIGDITYSTLVDELLCYGWIDSLARKMDETRTSIRISPRNPKSNWSRINKEKVARLTKEGRMQSAGQAAVALAKKTGTWDALNEVENLVLPDDLHRTLQNSDLLSVWEAQSRSKRRGLLERLLIAKKDTTRHTVITKIIKSLQ